MNKEYEKLILQFTEEGYKISDELSKEIYKLQKLDQEKLLNLIAKIMLSYNITDSVLKLSDIEKNKLRKDVNLVISSISKGQHQQEKGIIQNILETVSKKKYYSSAYALNIGMNFKLQNVTDDEIKKIVDEKIGNEIWNDRLWNNKKALEKNLKQQTENFLQGKTSVNKIEKDMKNKFNQNAFNTHRLIQTEVARCQVAANDLFAEKHGIKEQMFCATLDTRTSDFCREHDGNVYDIDDPNKPYLPAHPFCRSCYINVPYKEWKPTKRIDNITKEKIQYISYKEWYEKNVKNNPRALIEEKKIKNKSADKKIYANYKEILGKNIPKSLEEFQELKYNKVEEWNKLAGRYSKIFVTKDFKDIAPLFKGKLSNLETRKWYKWHDENIPNLIDKSTTIEEQAKQAHNLRNMYRTQARDLMKDQEERKRLDIRHPNPTFEELLEHKKLKYGLSEQEAYEDIVRSSQTTNKKYDNFVGIKEE